MERLERMGVTDHNFHVIDSNFLEGRAFEEYVFWLLEPLGFDDILLGAKVVLEDVGGRAITNEFDVLLIKNNRVFAIECKYARRLDGERYIYKYAALIDLFGPDSKAMIVNVSNREKESFLGSKTSANFSRGDIRRGLANNISVYHEERIEERKFIKSVRRFFGL